MRPRPQWTPGTARRWVASLLLSGSAVATGCGGPAKIATTPLPLQDDDRYDIPSPQVERRDDYYDILDYTVYQRIGALADVPRDVRAFSGAPKQAMNRTVFDEVLDSSWFTNRMGRRKLTVDELRQGPNSIPGPDMQHPWTVVSGKTSGVTPGFTIQDANGSRFVIKPDPKNYPELATGADAIATRLVWAFGFNVPEDYLVRFHPEALRISPKATVKLQLGQKRPLFQADLDTILAKSPREADGSIRVVASRYLPGKILGSIPFLGVRRDDPNDVIPHEHRRELRGYRMLCAWLNHNDSREINSLDSYVEEDGRHFVRHYIQDLNATLGSASIFPNLRSEGFEYQFDLAEMGKELFSLGLYERPWTRLQFEQIRGVGNFSAEHFDPPNWKQNYPFPPFDRMTALDAFWAAKIIVRFDDASLRTVIECAEYSDPKATEYVLRTLAARRDRIARYWFARVNPLDEFEVVGMPTGPAGKPGGASAGGPALAFADLAVRHGYVPPRRYRVQVRGPRGHTISEFETDGTSIPLAAPLAALGAPQPSDVEARTLELELRSSLPPGKEWTPATLVTLYLEPAGTLRVAAIERRTP